MFYLKKLKVNHKGRTLFDVEFSEIKEHRNQPFTTVLIGSNGAGKSYLLTIITEVFRALENIQKNKDYSLRYENYSLVYILKNKEYKIELEKKNTRKSSLQFFEFPEKVLASSFLVNDKFVFKATTDVDESSYEYLGVRRTSNATWISTISRKISEIIIQESNIEFHKKLAQILSFLRFDVKLSLVFEPTIKTLFKKPPTIKNMIKRNQNIKKSDDFTVSSMRNVDMEKISQIYSFINELKSRRETIVIGENNEDELRYNIDFVGSYSVLENDYQYLKLLMDLGYLNAPKILLNKNGDEFDFEYASSGEKHLFFTFLNIASKIKNNSLILIDEPELSLHPNWQIEYIDLLKMIFKEFSSCHFILATHSHHFISGLDSSSSSIVVLSQQEGLHIANLIEYDTFAWSSENILYNIFQVRTTRNHYFEMDLRELSSSISKETPDTDKIRFLINKLRKYSIDKNDPLNIILVDAERYLNNAEK